MEVEQKQADLVHQFVLLARDARGRAAAELITHATSNPQLFAFSELLSCNHIAEVVHCLFRLSLSREQTRLISLFLFPRVVAPPLGIYIIIFFTWGVKLDRCVGILILLCCEVLGFLHLGCFGCYVVMVKL
jgi:hypothetical protein